MVINMRFRGPRPKPCMVVILLIFSLSPISGVSSSIKSRDSATTATTQLNKKQTVALHHAVKKLLGFKDGPKTVEELSGRDVMGRVNGKSNSLAVAPPQYMLDLYERYKHGAISLGKMTGNTVRCIKADIGSVGGEKAFIFNLSSVARTERVFNAEIHLFRKRIRSRNSTISLRLHRVSLNKVYDAGSVDLITEARGWHATNMTPAVKSCISRRRSPGDVLAVTIRKVKKNSRKSRTMSLHRFMDHMTLPFLVLYSNDTQNITLDHVDPHFRATDLEEEIFDPEFGYIPNFSNSLSHHARTIFDYDDSADYDSEDGEVDVSNEKDDDAPFKGFGFDDDDAKALSESVADITDRKRRSIFDNEIPEEPVDNVKQGPFNVPLTNPIEMEEHVTQSQNESQKQEGKKEEFVKSEHKPGKTIFGKVDNRKNVGTEEKEYDLIPYPKDFKKERKNRRRNRRKNRKHRRRRPHQDRQLPLPPEWEAELKKGGTSSNANRDKLCRRRKLVVDFADIGWSDWIINPKSFEAHYCSGQCPFPLTKGLKPSNHATIQSLVHAIGIPADVPAPCCVPDVMSSVTLLYFDENRNVVLKNYPSMSVQSCACR